MNQLFFLFICLFVSVSSFTQNGLPAFKQKGRPALTVGIVVDQMRWDYLYRYYDRFKEGGFKRLLRNGFSCNNTHINYVPSVTGAGHATIYTGTVPAISGITGNRWIDRQTGNSVYSTGDSMEQTVGSTTIEEGQMSPRNLLTTTVTDELRLATNFKSRVVGIALKANASILSVGHSPTGAFWFDPEAGKFITSTYYMQNLPEWVQQFNNRKVPEKLIAKGWETLYPINTYKASTVDDTPWEGKFKGEKTASFPHDIAGIYKDQPAVIRQTPFGNTLTAEFAIAAMDAYNLGKNESTDFLAISFSSTDYIGHMYGVNAIETEDTYLRLDQDINMILTWLDKRVGVENYLVFLTSDHGAPNAILYNQFHKIPSGLWNNNDILKGINRRLKEETGIDSLVSSILSYQVHFNKIRIKKNDIDFVTVKLVALKHLKHLAGVAFAADNDNLEHAAIPGIIKTKMINGYNYKRSGDITLIPEAGWFSGSLTGVNHGTYNPYDTHIPLIFMGWNIKPGKTNRPVNITDIAPTIAALLMIQMPSGNIGDPIAEITDK